MTPPPPFLATPGQSIAASGIPALSGASGLAVSPDGRFVYVAGGSSSSLAVFARDPQSGALSWVQALGDPAGDLAGVRQLAISPDGQNLYAAAAGADAVVAFRRDQGTGLLIKLDTVRDGDGYICADGNGLLCPLNGLDGAHGVAVSPDGRHVYVTGNTDDAVVVLQRGDDGGLHGRIAPFFVQTFTPPNPGDLDVASGIAISPDGRLVYVSGYFSNTVLVLRRDASTGALSHLQTLSEGVDGVTGLGGPYALSASPDGMDVYVASSVQGAMAAFRRGTADDRLSLVEVVTGVAALGGVSGVAVTPDGARVVAASPQEDALVVFERDRATGALLLAQEIRRAGGGPLLDGARQVAVSPDGRTVYATANGDNRLVALERANPQPALTALAPASAPTGSGDLVVTLSGAGFVPGTTARAGGADLPTLVLADTLLEATIPAALLAGAGTLQLSIVNPAPGGGASAVLPFVVTAPTDNPVSGALGLAPAGAVAGSDPLTVTVGGGGFIPGTRARWNGADRPTTVLDGGTLQVSLTAADLSVPGLAIVTVHNPGPGGGSSNGLVFAVTAVGQAPPPSVTGVSPSGIVLGEQEPGPLTVTITGSGFTEGARARWAGSERPTRFISASSLELELRGDDLVAAGVFAVDVVSAAGDVSNAAPFSVAERGANPTPSLSAVSEAPQLGSAITLTLRGSGFVAGAEGRWNGQPYPSTLVSPTELRLSIPAGAVGRGIGTLRVTNPGPGGGPSNLLVYTLEMRPRVYLPAVRR